MKARAKTPPAFRTHCDIERWPWRGLTVTALHHVLHCSKISLAMLLKGVQARLQSMKHRDGAIGLLAGLS